MNKDQAKEDYYTQKARYAKSLVDRGLPFVKVYAPVRYGDGFLCLEFEKNDKQRYKVSRRYQIAGGGVDEGETLEEAIKRELKEEMHVEVEVLKELGVYEKLSKTWRLDGESFDVPYEIHVFDTKFKRKLSDGEMGLNGEFDDGVKIVKLDKKTMVENVTEFKDFGIKID